MKNLPFCFALFACILVFSGCEDEDPPIGTTSELTLTFNGRYGNNALDSDTGQDHLYDNGTKISFQKFSFYISDVVLYRDDETDKTELSEIEYIDLSKQNAASFNFRSVPTGNYSGIKFFLGVIEELNDDVPKDYNSEHPLGNSANHWSAWNSYIFCKLEGKLDLNDGSVPISFSYHTGSDDMLRSITIPYNFSLSADGNATINLNADVKNLLFADDDYLNIMQFSATHDPTNAEHLQTATYIMDNFPNVFSTQ